MIVGCCCFLFVICFTWTLLFLHEWIHVLKWTIIFLSFNGHNNNNNDNTNNNSIISVIQVVMLYCGETTVIIIVMTMRWSSHESGVGSHQLEICFFRLEGSNGLSVAIENTVHTQNWNEWWCWMGSFLRVKTLPLSWTGGLLTVVNEFVKGDQLPRILEMFK